MPNIADIIEEYIKARLSQSNSGIIIFRRNELAEKFRCVPSQINYVLSTRFSFNRGYIVETRRGGGGFVRIIRVPLEEAEDLLDIIYEKIGERVTMTEAMHLIRYLREEDLITAREAHIMQTVMEVATPGQHDPDMEEYRARIFKAMLMVLLRHEK